MSVIYGNFRYLVAFSSIEELKKDESLSDGKVVTVETSESASLYIIKDFMSSEETSIKLDNGFFANLVASSTSVTSLLYTTDKPIQVGVGNIKKGDTFTNVALSEVFNAMFYENREISFELDLNLSTLDYVEGDEFMLTNVSVKNIISDLVDRIALVINGEVLRTDYINSVIESHEFLINQVITNTTVVGVIVYTERSFRRVEETINFKLPCYWGVVDENFVISPSSLERLNREVAESDQVSVNISSANDCIIFAVESALGVKKILDESSNVIIDNFVKIPSSILMDGQSIDFDVYMSNRCSVDDFLVRFVLGEVS